jgi:dipeptidase D
MSSIIQHFITLTKIPHCSYEADKLFEFLVAFAKEREYSVQVDETKNILISKGSPKLCLQAHYDMVCIGKAPEIETYEEDGWLKARESSLGADNGMAIAMMMELMDAREELEFLITSDEEVGLIGANALAFDLHSKVMLNLDSEDEAEVYIGCAGGIDILATKPYAQLNDTRPSYSITVEGLVGGHSGVDIDKDIPNAIKLLASYLKDKDIGLVSIKGGERLNSIPTFAQAIVKSDKALTLQENVTIEAISNDEPILYGGDEIVSLLANISHGVRELNQSLGIPDRSINLARVSTEDGICSIETSTRAMDPRGMEQNSYDMLTLFHSYSYDTKQTEKYPAWKPEVNTFTSLVGECMQEVFGESQMKAIHAGLECGIISQKYPQIKIASIGPTIRYPHSSREMVKLDSVEKSFEVLKRVIEVV